jgi:predicted Rossmann fold flavoprotein
MKVIVVGGGAAGFFSAITCAEAHPQVAVTLLEASPQLLTKVRISGGGRCNVTHACFDPTALITHYPRGSKALRGPFSRFQPQDTVDWFAAHGVKLKVEPDGRMFPTTDDSATIVDCLFRSAQRAGVEVHTGSPVQGIMRSETAQGEPFFAVQLKQQRQIRGERLLLATGSHPLGYRLATGLGHEIMPPVPSLFTFNIADERLQGLAGVSVPQVQATLQVTGQSPLVQTGPLLITHWGLSGPAILKLSAWGARLLHNVRYRADLQINWMPQLNTEALRNALLQAKAEQPKRAVGKYCPVSLPQRLWQRLALTTGIPSDLRWADCSKAQLLCLLQEVQQSRFAIRGKGVFKEEFVTCGGISLQTINFKTMESRTCSGLYFAGEILNIDGVTGGFNFQNAWTTGWIAGQAMGHG